MMETGIILINKPEDVRSTDCVTEIRKKLKIKTGHAGTLDSTASGLLIILTGNATRLSEYIMSLPKIYYASIKLGSETDTCDYSGKIINESEFNYKNNISEKNIDDELYNFRGMILQTPPEISALKINGKPSYKLARSGAEIKILPRPVMVYEIARVSELNNGIFKLKIKCGKGTYIRSIARDLGRKLGCYAHIKSLERFSIGNFDINQADENKNENKKIELKQLINNFNNFVLSAEDALKFSHGINIPVKNALKFNSGISNLICVTCEDNDENNENKNNLFGFAEIHNKKLKPVANIFL